ncbi:immunoglobulin lambda-1 light chain-like isoform X2 [Notolabrus celidotus]|uniref:immunoglobulin lambda-1 light chain-like isoform X2 n=1 Tax=Notolabrus celidotus TaxID=1203425 RepID=UPI00148F617B|nr:immunoglobulin lambda-1 light chain-like isoform X2 [Notolabrus celidotus]
MLGSLCTLITALTCVSAVTLVTQKPPVVTVRRGETATMDCDVFTDDGSRWYKHVPGGTFQFVLRNHLYYSSPKYGSGISPEKFTSSHLSGTEYRLTIMNVDETDSAVYICETWDDSAKEHVFGGGSKLIVTGSSLPPPVLTVFPPSSAELQSNKASLVCLSSQSVPFADVSWFGDGCPVSSGISTSTAVQQADQTFQISSYLSINPSQWIMGKVFTCKVSLGLQTSEKNITVSDCSKEGV